MARSDWQGSISFIGFPVGVSFFSVLSAKKDSSFKMLDPIHKQPVKQQLVDKDGNTVTRAETLRGVESGPGQFAVLTEEALELVEKNGRSQVLEIAYFSPVDTVSLQYSRAIYQVVPNDKMPGSDQSLQILWNGLHKAGNVAVIEGWSQKANSIPRTLVIVADDSGLLAHVLPYAAEIKHDSPGFTPEVNEKAAKMFSGVVEQNYKTQAFDINAIKDVYGERREAAIALALSGESINVDTMPESPIPTAPDLMQMLEASLAEAKKDEKPKPKRSSKPKAKTSV